MSILARAFPALSGLKEPESEQVSLVNGAIVEEVLLDLGEVDFGKGVMAKANVALWRTRGEHAPLVGEFAYQCKFERRKDVHAKARSAVSSSLSRFSTRPVIGSPSERPRRGPSTVCMAMLRKAMSDAPAPPHAARPEAATSFSLLHGIEIADHGAI